MSTTNSPQEHGRESVEDLLEDSKRELSGMEERRNKLVKTIESCEHILTILPPETTIPLPLKAHPMEQASGNNKVNQREFIVQKLELAGTRGATCRELRTMYQNQFSVKAPQNFPYSPLNGMRKKGTVVDRDGKLYLPQYT